MKELRHVNKMKNYLFRRGDEHKSSYCCIITQPEERKDILFEEKDVLSV